VKVTTKIKVVGIGGSGCNTISRMTKYKLQGVELIALNTDAQILRTCPADKKILLGENTTKGLGAGMNVSLGEKAALESKNGIKEALKSADMVFITAGLGGGTGSAGSPVVADITKGLGILTIAVVTKPFSFEGSQRKRIANNALKQLRQKVDTLLVIPNDKLLKLIDEKTKVSQAFSLCDEALKQAVQGITDLIVAPSIVNVDFADVKAIMKSSGQALFGMGVAKGDKRALEAAKKAINSSLLDFSIRGAKGILFNVSGRDVTLSEVGKIADVVTKKADPKAEIIFGAVEDKELNKGEIKVTVIATGF